MYLEGLIITHKIRVSNLEDHDIILGLDFLKENGDVIAYPENILTLRDDLVMIPLYSNTKHISCISAAKNMRIPPFAEALILVVRLHLIINQCFWNPYHQSSFETLRLPRLSFIVQIMLPYVAS